MSLADWLPAALPLLAAVLGLYGLVCVVQAAAAWWERRHASPVRIVGTHTVRGVPAYAYRRDRLYGQPDVRTDAQIAADAQRITRLMEELDQLEEEHDTDASPGA